jgi:hypothetical protein
MQVIQFKVNDNYIQLILSMLQSLKSGIIEDLSIIKNDSKESVPNMENGDIFSKTSGIISSHNIDPIEWQNSIRSEWDR